MTEREYIELHSSRINEALTWLEHETHLRTSHARMLSGQAVGHVLKMASAMLRPRRILELGVFTGYSTICLASGIEKNADCIIDAIEINDELEDLIREGYCKAGIDTLVRLHIGDATEIIASLEGMFDLVYIDANKREYPEYYNLVIDRVPSGGMIIADNVLWDGKVLKDPLPQDSQTLAIAAFNNMVRDDPRVDNFILPVRDGLNIIRKK